jgi:biopolymer transport protein ExbD
MKMRRIFERQSVLALAALTVWLAAGCKHQEQKGEQKAPKPLATPGLNVPKPTERVAALEEDMQVQPARSTSDAGLPLPWLEPTPVVGADVQQGVRTWPRLAVLIGRKQVWIGDKAIAPTHCQSKEKGNCTDDAIKAGSTVALFGFQADQLSDGKLTALSGPAGAWKDQQVQVIADRRVNWQAVETVMATLRAAGAKPVLSAGSHEGDLVDALGVGTALPEAPTLIAARRASEPGESVPGGLPSDATALTIFVTAGGVSVEVGRESGEPANPEILGNMVESLIALAQRVRQAAPKVTSVTIRIDPDVPMEQVIQVIDGVRDDCGRTSRGQKCTSRTQLFAVISLEMTGGAPEPAKIGIDAPLHLDAPAGSGLHLGDAPGNDAKPATPGLHL